MTAGSPVLPSAPVTKPTSPIDADRVGLARDFAYQLSKGIKSVGLYRHSTARFESLLLSTEQTLGRFTEKHGPLALKVEAECLSLAGQPIFTAEEGGDTLPYRFYRDGIRQLIFRPGLTSAELVSFVLIALPDPLRADDTIALLWKAQLAHLDYVAVEGFSVGDSSSEQVQVEVDDLVQYLYQRLQSDSADTLGFARLRLEDLDAKLQGVEQIRGVVVTGAPVPEELRQRLQLQLATDHGGLLETVVRAIAHAMSLQVLTDGAVLQQLFGELLDGLLLEENYRGVALLRSSLADPADSAAPVLTALRASLLASVIDRMSDGSRLRQLAAAVDRAPSGSKADFVGYLSALGESALEPLLEALQTIGSPSGRQLFLDALVRLATVTKDPAPFVRGLSSDSSQTVKDMLGVIDRCEFPDKRKYFAMVMANKNPVVRQEALAQLSGSKTQTAVAMLIQALNDPSGGVRVQAARSLAACAPEQAVIGITRMARSPDFERLPLKEREALYAALGLTCLPAALGHFGELLKIPNGMLARKRVTEDKLCSIAGLLAMETVQAFKALQSAGDDRGNDDGVRDAARNAMVLVRRSLSGVRASAS